MKSEIELIFPFPPTLNSYYAQNKYTKYLSKKGRLYTEKIEECVVEQSVRPHLSSRLCVEVILFPPDRRQRDLDNYQKCLFDALTKCNFWVDDSLIDQMFVYRGVVTVGGLCILKVNEAGPIMPRPEYLEK